MNTLSTLILFFVGVLAFAGNLFYRVIILYVRHRDGEPINWWWEIVVIFGLPLAVMLAIMEVMYVLGWFGPSDKHFY
jgi:hypothetical protein